MLKAELGQGVSRTEWGQEKYTTGFIHCVSGVNHVKEAIFASVFSNPHHLKCPPFSLTRELIFRFQLDFFQIKLIAFFHTLEQVSSQFLPRALDVLSWSLSPLFSTFLPVSRRSTRCSLLVLHDKPFSFSTL